MARKGGKRSGVGQHTHRTGQQAGLHQLIDLIADAADMVQKPPGRAVLHLSSVGGKVNRHGGQHGAVHGIQIVEDRAGQHILPLQIAQESGEHKGIRAHTNAVSSGIRAKGSLQDGRIVADRAQMELHGQSAAAVLSGQESQQGTLINSDLFLAQRSACQGFFHDRLRIAHSIAEADKTVVGHPAAHLAEEIERAAQGDYTEEYQAYYQEELIKQLFTRKYMWATHVWNMFDFGADARNEGGENGQNHKGLVTFDRKYKKDSFYAYKAWLSGGPFVHLCGKRYIDRVEDVTKVTVYSNQPEVELFANGVSLGKKTAADHFFYFDVPNAGATKLEAVAGDCRDESVINKVETFNESYRLVEKGAILNWFDIEAPEGYFSLNDKMGDVISTVKGKLLFMTMFAKMMGGKKGKDGEAPKMEAMGFEINADMMSMMNGFTVLRLFTLTGGMMDVKFTKGQLLDINAKLNKIKKKD